MHTTTWKGWQCLKISDPRPAAAGGSGGGVAAQPPSRLPLTCDCGNVHQSGLALGGVVGLPPHGLFAEATDAIHSRGACAALRHLGEQAWLRHGAQWCRGLLQRAHMSGRAAGACRAVWGI